MVLAVNNFHKKILFLVNEHKDWYSVNELCEKIKCRMGEGVEVLPISDGGNGFSDALLLLEDMKREHFVTHKCNGEQVEVSILWHLIKGIRIGYFETATILGSVRNEQIDSKRFHSRGMKDVFENAKRLKLNKLIIGLGGSKTSDAGIGMLQSMGCQIQLETGEILEDNSQIGFQTLSYITDIKRPKLQFDFEVEVWSDTSVMMYGGEGQAHVFGPQKGMNSEEVSLYDKGLKKIANIYWSKFNIDVQKENMGGSGGIASALHYLFNAQVVSGSEMFFTNFIQNRIMHYRHIIFTEGCYDETSAHGKISSKVIQFCNWHNLKLTGFFALDKSADDNTFERVTYLDSSWTGDKAQNERLLLKGLIKLKRTLNV